MATGMIIDGVLGSQCVDSSGEILDVDGADVSDLEEGRGVLNYEHKGAEDKDSNGQEIVGKILTAKKIFKEGDCDNARQRAYWKKVKHPFIYGVCRLYDGAGHEGAKALAAQIRDHHANAEPILVRFSVEGSTLEKDGNVLKRSVIRRVALTLKPCNRTADSGLIEDPHAPVGFEKKPVQKVGDILADLTEDAKKMEHQHPGYTKLGGAFETEYSEFTEDDHSGLVKSLVKLRVMRRLLAKGDGPVKKALTAGSMDAAPSQLTGGAALQREDIIRRMKPKAMRVLKNFLDKNDSFDRAKLVQILKQELPEASEPFIDHFAAVAEDYTVKLRKADGPPKNVADLPPADLRNDKDILSDEAAWMKAVHTAGSQVQHDRHGFVGRVIQPAKDGVNGQGQDAMALVEHDHEGAKAQRWYRATELSPRRTQSTGTVLAFPGIKKTETGTPAQSRMKVKRNYPVNDGLYAAVLDPDDGMSKGVITPDEHARFGEVVHAPWRQTMENWLPLNAALRSGKTSPGLIATAVVLDALGRDSSGKLLDLIRSGRVDPFRLDDEEQSATAALYPHVEQLVSEHGGDARTMGTELTGAGLGAGAARFLLSSLGAGSMSVPDRWTVASTFGVPMDQAETLRQKISANPSNEQFLRGIDHGFFVNHPAVRHVLNQYPRHFFENEHEALLPAMWLHWLSEEQHRGMTGPSSHLDPHRRLFWDDVQDELIKHGLKPHPFHDVQKSDPWQRHPNHLDHPTWLKAVGAVDAIRRRWGETPALLAMFTHVVPTLLRGDSPVPPVAHAPHPAYHPHLFKVEALLLDLRKTLADANAGDDGLAEIAPHIHHVYAYRPGQDLKIRRYPSGRYTTAGGHLHLLEDYHGELARHLVEGQLTPDHEHQQAALRRNPNLDVASLHEINSGARPELWTPPSVQAPARPQSVFDYVRAGQEKSDHLEFRGGQAFLNGQQIDHGQTRAMLQHVQNGHAAVRYKTSGSQEAVRKMELVLETLMKAADHDPKAADAVHAALGRLDELVKLGHLEPHHADALRNHAFKDPMTGHTMGNKFAYTDFMNRSDSKGGIHVVMDGNDFKSVNDKFGHEVGDSSIKAMGRALREAMDETVGSEHGKLFRVGGDEFAAHVPTHEHAAKFARAVRAKMEAIPAIQGSHRLSMGLGFGTSPQHADKALYEAKKQKYDPAGMTGTDSRKWISKYQPGQAPSLAHSLVPGFEGGIPLDHTQLHVKPPPAPQQRPDAPTPIVPVPAPQQPASAPVSPAIKSPRAA